MSAAAARQTRGDLTRRADASVRKEIDAARERMRGLGFGCDQIAGELARRYKLRPRKAYRIACGWTQTEAAARLNARAAEQGTDPDGRASLTGSHLCEHEQWPYGGRRPSVSLLLLMATVYGTDVVNLLDLADYQHLPPGDRLILQHAALPHTSQPVAGYSAFGDELIRLLADRKLSQRKIAQQVPCDAGYLSHIIHGQSRRPARSPPGWRNCSAWTGGCSPISPNLSRVRRANPSPRRVPHIRASRAPKGSRSPCRMCPDGWSSRYPAWTPLPPRAPGGDRPCG